MWSFMSLGSCLARSQTLGLCACFPGVSCAVVVLVWFHSSQTPDSESSLVCR